MAALKNRLFVLKDPEGTPLRVIRTQARALQLVQNRETKRLEILDAQHDCDDTYRVLQRIDLEENKSSFVIQNLGTLSYAETGVHGPMDPPALAEEDPQKFPFLLKWSSGFHGTGALLFILFGLFLPKHNSVPTPEPESLVLIQLEQLPQPPKTAPPPSNQKRPTPTKKTQPKKTAQRVVPRKDKSKPLLPVVTQTQRVKKAPPTKTPQKVVSQKAPAKAPNDFQRLGALSSAIKGSRDGLGSGLRPSQGGTGGQGTGAGAGRGSGTSGHGSDAGGGYEQALYGKGLTAGQVGSGSGGLGSGWGQGSQGQGGFGTKGKGSGHSGYGQSQVGSGASQFSYPVRNEAVIEGGLDREAVDLVVTKNLGQIIYCYEIGLQKNAGLRGRVLVDFTINGKGRVSSTHIANSSLNSPAVENCMISKIKNWKFPQPAGGVNVDVNYPFALQRVSRN